MITVDVKTKNGIIRGEKSGSMIVFKGVPYAEAPVDGMRFAAPSMKRPWTGVLEALSFGKICPQADPRNGFYGKEFYTDPDFPLPEMSEDCLNLNIWAPAEEKEGGYPVAVWIHGGAFDHGYSSEMEFDGQRYAKNGVVLVTINYRVGIFGFFADDSLAKEHPHKTTGNYGLLDQIEALKWVKNNISAFHGDPDNITLFGQSAGAMSVQALISSPLTKGLVSSAIMQSGGGYDNGLAKTKTLEEAKEVSAMIMSLCHVKSVDALRKVPAQKLVDILPSLYEKINGLAFGPVVDQYVLTETCDAALENNHVHNIPYMLGVTGNDISILPDENTRKSRFYLGCKNFAKKREEAGGEPVYLYFFDRKLPSDDAGAFHSSELWYVFYTLGRCWREMSTHDYQLADKMTSAWIGFMKDKNPGWNAYTEKEDFVRTFM